jgi:hypothetical protein
LGELDADELARGRSLSMAESLALARELVDDERAIRAGGS